jgi:hypothetical protein
MVKALPFSNSFQKDKTNYEPGLGQQETICKSSGI